jgi:putative oxidoreductase
MKTAYSRLQTTGLILMSLVFLWSAVDDKLSGWSATVGYVASKGLPAPSFWVFSGAVIELLVPAALLFRRWRALAAAVLSAYSLATALIFHAFWITGNGAGAELQEFLKDAAIAGGFLFIYATERLAPSSASHGTTPMVIAAGAAKRAAHAVLESRRSQLP